ncbi:hypothetical protein CSKR_112568 [Clonorchis sinensis]|uniref:Uncharacterized protein n=1 Tax=Clonorchis sinensis TaxID=79923 RepID=A0A419PZK6_CLOSI|nr:hypothetical protein CSKR_112568 [Clonorchis sinensis]
MWPPQWSRHMDLGSTMGMRIYLRVACVPLRSNGFNSIIVRYTYMAHAGLVLTQ